MWCPPIQLLLWHAMCPQWGAPLPKLAVLPEDGFDSLLGWAPSDFSFSFLLCCLLALPASCVFSLPLSFFLKFSFVVHLCLPVPLCWAAPHLLWEAEESTLLIYLRNLLFLCQEFSLVSFFFDQSKIILSFYFIKASMPMGYLICSICILPSRWCLHTLYLGQSVDLTLLIKTRNNFYHRIH